MRGLVIAAILCVQSLCFAADRFIYFGGGDPAKPKDPVIFDDGFFKAIEFAKQKDIPAEYFYRKNHPKVPAEVGKQLRTFTPANFKTKIQQLTNDIASGKVKPGDQLMIMVDSHGKIDGKPGEVEFIANGERVSDVTFKKLVDAANKKGVRLAILGGTCYSGTLMKYMSDNVCVIAGAQPDRTAQATFWELFLDELRNNKNPNLEVAFLRARLGTKNAERSDQPMISTPAGVYADQVLGPVKKAVFLDEEEVEVDVRNDVCNGDLSNTSLAAQSRNFQRLQGRSVAGASSSAKFRNHFTQLNGLYSQYQALRNQVQAHLLAGEQRVCREEKTNCQNFESVANIMTQGYVFDCNSPGFASIKAECPKQNEEAFKFAQQIAARSDYRQWLDGREAYKNTLSAMTALSTKITQHERVLYDELYKKALGEFKGPNACRDFKL